MKMMVMVRMVVAKVEMVMMTMRMMIMILMLMMMIVMVIVLMKMMMIMMMMIMIMVMKKMIILLVTRTPIRGAMLTEALRMYWDGAAGAVGLVLRAHDADVRVAVTLAAPVNHHVGDAVVVRLQHLQI